MINAKFLTYLFMITVVNTWRGHVDSISCIELVEKNKVIMTASIDCTVRLWNYEGNYIGKF